MKNTLEWINSRIKGTERISELEDRLVEITAGEQNKEKRMKRNEDSLRDLWDNIKYPNIHIIGVPEGEEKGPEKLFEEIIAQNIPNMRKETHLSPGSAQSPMQDKPKKEHTKTHNNQADKK